LLVRGSRQAGSFLPVMIWNEKKDGSHFTVLSC
jgi:hypothetical protein